MFNFFKKKKRVNIKTPQVETLAEQMKNALPSAMILPGALEMLFDWIETNGLAWSRDGTRNGSLTAYGTSKSTSAPYIEFYPEGSRNLKYWFGHDERELHDRLFVFSKTGAEGSMGAFWLDDNGKQHIVHIGSGSGSIMTCILTDNAIDFLRLLAIGYDEICWGEFSTPPSTEIPINNEFRKWVETAFSVSIPSKGDEIVAETAEMGQTETTDAFLKWTSDMIAKGSYV